jgi:hypothetical protein
MRSLSKCVLCGVLGLALMESSNTRAQTLGAPQTIPDYNRATQDLPTYFAPSTIPELATQQECQCSTESYKPLTLANFFTAGWNEEYTRHPMTEDVAPDFALLRVQTNFLERELRVNYFHEYNINSPKQSAIDSLDTLIAYALNRRFMIEVLGNYEWIDGRGKTPDESGPAARLVGRVQLVDTLESSYSFNFQAITPDPGLGVHTTTLSYGLAGWEDLTKRLGLSRVGLYYSVLFDSLAGPHASGATLDDVQYVVTVAKTLTSPDTPLFGNFTVFTEFFSQTSLNGIHEGSTLTTVTPACRFNLGAPKNITGPLGNWILVGVDIPVTGPRPYDANLRLTYILTF